MQKCLEDYFSMDWRNGSSGEVGNERQAASRGEDYNVQGWGIKPYKIDNRARYVYFLFVGILNITIISRPIKVENIQTKHNSWAVYFSRKLPRITIAGRTVG